MKRELYIGQKNIVIIKNESFLINILYILYHNIQKVKFIVIFTKMSSHTQESIHLNDSYDSIIENDMNETTSSGLLSGTSSCNTPEILIQKDCLICGDSTQTLDHNSNNPIIQTDCNHDFHYTCLAEWFKENKNRNCPYCTKKYGPIPSSNPSNTINGFNNDIITPALQDAYVFGSTFNSVLFPSSVVEESNNNGWCIWNSKYFDYAEVNHTIHFGHCYKKGIDELHHLCLSHFKRWFKYQNHILLQNKVDKKIREIMKKKKRCTYHSADWQCPKKVHIVSGDLNLCRMHFIYNVIDPPIIEEVNQWRMIQKTKIAEYEQKIHEMKTAVCKGYYSNGNKCTHLAKTKYHGYCGVHKFQHDNPLYPIEDIQDQAKPNTFILNKNFKKCEHQDCENTSLKSKTTCVIHSFI
jgi:hypothetical protein